MRTLRALSDRYTKGVDMWSLGCIVAEMLLERPLFPGTSTVNQIERIMATLDAPSPQDVASVCSGSVHLRPDSGGMMAFGASAPARVRHPVCTQAGYVGSGLTKQPCQYCADATYIRLGSHAVTVLNARCVRLGICRACVDYICSVYTKTRNRLVVYSLTLTLRSDCFDHYALFIGWL